MSDDMKEGAFDFIPIMIRRYGFACRNSLGLRRPTTVRTEYPKNNWKVIMFRIFQVITMRKVTNVIVAFL